MGRHSKPRSRRATRGLTAVVGIAGSMAVTQGLAHADTPTGPPGGWSSLVQCESGGNPKAQNRTSSASGLFQFITATWLSNGGGRFAKRAKFASPQQQAVIAAKVFREQGLRPWDASKHCWGSRVAAAKRRGEPAPMTTNLQEMLHPGAKPAPRAKPAPKAKPKVKAAPKPAHRKHARSRSAGAEHHRVRSGDTLSQIAVNNGMTWQELFAMNRAEVSNPNQIFPGMSLELP